MRNLPPRRSGSTLPASSTVESILPRGPTLVDPLPQALLDTIEGTALFYPGAGADLALPLRLLCLLHRFVGSLG
jgi:hypothetical protein